MSEKKKELSNAEFNSQFLEHVRTNLDILIYERNHRPIPKKGFRYKRDWYDRMSQDGCLSAEYFVKNIIDIWNMKSNLNSQYRYVIAHVCNKAIQEVMENNKLNVEIK